MDQLLTYDETAKYLRRSKRYVQRLVAREDIPFIRLPGSGVRFKQSEIEKWLNRHSKGNSK